MRLLRKGFILIILALLMEMVPGIFPSVVLLSLARKKYLLPILVLIETAPQLFPLIYAFTIGLLIH